MPESEVKDLSLAEAGRRRIEWADSQMPVLRLLRDRFESERPLQELRVAACLHVTSETANLIRTLAGGGAVVALCASNPLSTQDEVAASLVADFGQSVFASRGVDNDGYYRQIDQALSIRPHLTIDDGADLIMTLHGRRTELIHEVFGGTEETTTGVTRLKAMAEAGALRYPIVAVNDAKTKHMFDNRYGTGQSAIDGVIRATNFLLAGHTVVVCGYGMSGRGVADRAAGLGSNVVVTEVDPLPALEAVMDGFRVMPSLEAAEVGDVFITVTGDRDVLTQRHFERMKDGAILANAGHFDIEIDVTGLHSMATQVRKSRENVEEFILPAGKRLYLLAEGRLVNLAAAEGHPAAVMDMSFANQALALEWLVKNRGLAPGVYPVPEDIDREVARLKLESMGIAIDELTTEQAAYLKSWEAGT
jgi:adenosylhomocysteinase